MISELAGGPRKKSRDLVRAAQWWDYKLVPIFAFFYATAALLGVPIVSLWPAAAILLGALAAGAAYVSLVNDVTDRKEDEAAGKPNRMLGRSRSFIALAILLPVAAGLVFAWLWRGDPVLLASYLAAWVCFSLYSIPPFRLKTRGLAGLLADSAGSNLFPTLVATILAFRSAGAPLDPLWLATCAALAFAWGLRGILWHQLLDSENDRTAGVATFVQRRSYRAAAAIGRYVAFPAELAALALLLWRLADPAPAVALILYAALTAWRARDRRGGVTIVEPAPTHSLLLQDYYDFLLPLALLVASAIRFPADLLVIAAHLILFPRRPLQILREARDAVGTRSRRVDRPGAVKGRDHCDSAPGAGGGSR